MKEAKELGKLNHHKVDQPSFEEAAEIMDHLDRKKSDGPENSVIGQRARIPNDKVEAAVSFWKPIYFSVTAEGRLLNGVEAYDLGNAEHQVHPDKAIYIAMCNLMALTALRMMGDSWPTMEDAADLAAGTERERDIAGFWKNTYAPTLFQARWAWSAVMAVLAGDPTATKELIYNYKDQLPQEEAVSLISLDTNV